MYIHKYIILFIQFILLKLIIFLKLLYRLFHKLYYILCIYVIYLNVPNYITMS